MYVIIKKTINLTENHIFIKRKYISIIMCSYSATIMFEVFTFKNSIACKQAGVILFSIIKVFNIKELLH